LFHSHSGEKKEARKERSIKTARAKGWERRRED